LAAGRWLRPFGEGFTDVITKQQWPWRIVGVLGVLIGLFIIVGQFALLQHYKAAEHRHWKERYTKAAKRLEQATTDEARFYPLTELAKGALYFGATNQSRAYAQQLLAMAPQFKEDWNYGNAIHDGNEVLGIIAVQEGRISDAKHFLLEAGKNPGSPQLDSFGPDMELAQHLLEHGERATVLEYLQLCSKFWKDNNGLLERWTVAIKSGKVPDLQEKYP
jgi:hypothetical protein